MSNYLFTENKAMYDKKNTISNAICNLSRDLNLKNNLNINKNINYNNITHTQHTDKKMADNALPNKFGRKGSEGKRTKKIPTSYGIILGHVDRHGRKRFMICKRRSSYEYREFINGGYGYLTDEGKLIQNPKKKLRYLFLKLSNKEIQRIRDTDDFNKLFNDEWLGTYGEWLSRHYSYSRDKYEIEKEYIKELSNKCNNKPTYKKWMFPAGRKEDTDSCDFSCALREFLEETKLSEDLILVKKNPIQVTYKGSDNKLYRYNYYIMTTDEQILPPKCDPMDILKEKRTNLKEDIDDDYSNCIRNCDGVIRTSTVSDEASKLKWITINEGYKYLDSPFVNALYTASKHLNLIKKVPLI